MAKKKPKNGRRTTDIPGKATRPSTQATPKGTTKKKDPGGFFSPGFKSDGFQEGKRKTKTGPPPSVRARDEKRAKQPPPVKYAGKRKAPKTKIPKPLPRSQPSSRRGQTWAEYTKARKSKGAVGGGRK